MLNGNDMKSGFPISTSNYNIFDDANLTWLKRVNCNSANSAHVPVNDVDDDLSGDSDTLDDAIIAKSIENQLKCKDWIQKSVAKWIWIALHCADSGIGNEGGTNDER